jgi:hypothetical protein
MIEALYSVVEAVTDLAWSVHPIQLISDDDPEALWDSIVMALRVEPAGQKR